MRFPFHLRYLHEKPLPRNPLWNPGDPRHKIFLPLYWLKMVEPRKPIPEDFVKFECHWQMTLQDVRQYLEKLYGVKSLDVRIEIEKGEYIKHPKRPGLLSPPMPDRKYAYVQLKDQKFSFPKLFDSHTTDKLDENIKAMENLQNKVKNKSLNRLDIGSWFS
jgi:large subunit ribosomal protein L23